MFAGWVEARVWQWDDSVPYPIIAYLPDPSYSPDWSKLGPELVEALKACQEVRDQIRAIGIKRDDTNLYQAIMLADAKTRAALAKVAGDGGV